MEKAKVITELREGLRRDAAAVATTKSQSDFYDEKELEKLSERVS